MKEKCCKECDTTKRVDEFYRHKRDGLRSMCISCSKEYNKRYYGYFKEYRERSEVKKRRRAYLDKLRASGHWKTPEERKKNVERQLKLRKDPIQKLKYNARRYANKMKNRGKIQQLPCAECGRTESQAHHEDYKQPLLIVWLCLECHTKLHAELRRLSQ